VELGSRGIPQIFPTAPAGADDSAARL